MSVESLASVGDLSAQRALSRGQVSAIPGLLGGKGVWLPLVLDLVRLVGEGKATELDSIAEISFDLSNVELRQGGTAPKREPATWREYYSFLRGLRLVESSAGGLRLDDAGLKLQASPDAETLAEIMADRVRLFAETLLAVVEKPLTLEEADDLIQSSYKQSWRSRGNTRVRMDWQEVLGLIESVGNRRWQATSSGRLLLQERLLVTPDAFGVEHESIVDIAEPPAIISESLDELRTNVRTHESRSTYNIWVPSPPSDPNKVENLRTIVNSAFERIEREELFSLICKRFNLKRSSVNSMLPFMRASGLLTEVGRGVFESTPEARAWVESGDDLNFIRIIHSNMRFVGEMIRAVEGDVTRNVMYAQAKSYGMNTDKCRWLASFLLDTDLIEESRYGSLRATARGVALLAQLPLADPPPLPGGLANDAAAVAQHAIVEPEQGLGERLDKISREPHFGGLAPGRGLEVALRDVFLSLGFEARTIGGSKDTDVVVRWSTPEGAKLTAIVEAKARSSGSANHTDVSDVAIETHKSRHQASFVAIVAPSFSGETIKEMAKKKSWSLLEAGQLGSLAEASRSLGLRPCDVGVLFQVPSGLSDLEDVIASHRRSLEIFSFVIAKLSEEAAESGEAISARDISRDGRRSELSPSVDEVVSAIESLSRLQVDVLRLVEDADDPKFATYALGDLSAGSAQLRAIADAIDRGPLAISSA